MRVLQHLRKQTGITLLELILYAGAVGIIGYWVVGVIRTAQSMTRQQVAGQWSDTLNRAGDQMMSDILQADPTSIQWTQLPPTNPTAIDGISFNVPCYDMASRSTCPPTAYSYVFQSTGTSTAGSLIRVVGSSSTVLVSMDAPTQSLPLVQQDTVTISNANLLDITLCFTPPQMGTIKVTRRVAINQ